MKKIDMISLVTAFLIGANGNIYAKTNASEPKLIDSGIDYTERVGTINNPAAGYTTAYRPNCSPGNTPVYDPTENMVIFFVNIGDFSIGINGVKDYDLDDTFFDSWRETLANCRRNGCMVAFRFRYDTDGKQDPDPAEFNQILAHVEQIKNSGILEDYKDIIAYVESGFIGKWGEQHGSKFDNVKYKAQLLDAMLKAVPPPIPVTVRTPDTFAEWAGIKRSELGDYTAESGTDAARVGIYDDGYLGSDSDLGTYANRDIETSWLNKQAVTSYFGGEFSGNIEYAHKYENYLPKNAIPEMYKTHLSYINSNIFSEYKDYTFGEECDVSGVDNSAYYGTDVFQFIRDHIGYRFVLRKSELSPSVEQGGQLDLHFSVENTGFANPIPSTRVSFIIEHNGEYMRAFTDIDPNEWYSCTTADEKISFDIPTGLEEGKWNIYLKAEMGENTVDQLALRSIEFANNGIWNEQLGANYMGSFDVKKADPAKNMKTDPNHFVPVDEVSAETSARQEEYPGMYTLKGDIILDGTISNDYEWTDDMIVTKDGNNTLWLTTDDNYLYVLGKMPNTAKTSVYSLKFTFADDESYRLSFYQSGYIHYEHNNKEVAGNAKKSAACKWSSDYVEFRIPLGLFALENGGDIKQIRLFLEDSANGWKTVSEIRTGELKINKTFKVYSTAYDMLLSDYTGTDKYNRISVKTLENGADYKWYFNGKELKRETGIAFEGESLLIKKPETGTYSVCITSPDGASRTVDAAYVKCSDAVIGDLNDDGEVNAADLVIMQDFLLGRKVAANVTLNKADINNDGMIDVFDNCAIRKIVINK